MVEDLLVATGQELLERQVGRQGVGQGQEQPGRRSDKAHRSPGSAMNQHQRAGDCVAHGGQQQAETQAQGRNQHKAGADRAQHRSQGIGPQQTAELAAHPLPGQLSPGQRKSHAQKESRQQHDRRAQRGLRGQENEPRVAPAAAGVGLVHQPGQAGQGQHAQQAGQGDCPLAAAQQGRRGVRGGRQSGADEAAQGQAQQKGAEHQAERIDRVFENQPQQACPHHLVHQGRIAGQAQTHQDDPRTQCRSGLTGLAGSRGRRPGRGLHTQGWAAQQKTADADQPIDQGGRDSGLPATQTGQQHKSGQARARGGSERCQPVQETGSGPAVIRP